MKQSESVNRALREEARERQLPYAAVSSNGRADEWRVPLWDAIDTMVQFVGPPKRARRAFDVMRVERAVDIAMRLAFDCADPDPAYVLGNFAYARELFAALHRVTQERDELRERAGLPPAPPRSIETQPPPPSPSALESLSTSPSRERERNND